MARTSYELISEIMDIASGVNLTSFITAANSLVTRCCTNLTTDYSDEELINIETWLAAHLYTVKEQLVDSEKAGSVSQKYQYKIDLGFNSSRYGQTAMQLDYHGGLSSLNQKILNGSKSPGVYWLGKEDVSNI